LETVSTVYEVPLILENYKLDTFIINKLGLKSSGRRNTAWVNMVRKIKKAKKHKIRLALVGKYMGMKDTYLSVIEAIKAAGLANDADVQVDWVDAEKLQSKGTDALKGANAILVP